MDHIEEGGNDTVGIGNDWEIYLRAGYVPDIGRPTVVRLQVIDRNGNGLYVALAKLIFQQSRAPQFGGADRRKISGVREQPTPHVAQPFVKMDVALSSVGYKIGGNTAQT